MLILSVSLLQHIMLQLCYYQWKAAALRAEVQSSIFVTLTVSGNPLLTNSVYQHHFTLQHALKRNGSKVVGAV